MSLSIGGVKTHRIAKGCYRVGHFALFQQIVTGVARNLGPLPVHVGPHQIRGLAPLSGSLFRLILLHKNSRQRQIWIGLVRSLADRLSPVREPPRVSLSR